MIRTDLGPPGAARSGEADTGADLGAADSGEADSGEADSGAPEVVLAEVQESPLSVDAVLDAVRHPRAGGVATFIGMVRETDHGQGVEALDYTAHPSASQVLREVAQRVAAGGEVISVAVVHRVGHLVVGDIAVVVAASAVHRGAALDVCRELIDAVKLIAPIWKHQVFADGTDEWVGSP